MIRDVLGKTFRLVGYTIQYGCIAHCAFEYVGGVVVCSGPSMEPTIQSSDIVFTECLSRHFYGIQRGDIIIAKSPSDPKSNICKRVVGLEGDKILTSSPSDFLKSHSYELPFPIASRQSDVTVERVLIAVLLEVELHCVFKTFLQPNSRISAFLHFTV
ncbi:mitochondrial inner membrane protease subunit 1 isoform X2 [Ornithorhynchus anatinus]|uniref:Mitochondrial inner membrane protease subunit n=1 Tax=Ornithorhynchus anatinus TaxID=9258 RepID=A0A6I8NI25_ORNAN|nr:mitochondrial inner membrane protease subunit 1 isoform X2 [Ornithorhynchus anatinus]